MVNHRQIYVQQCVDFIKHSGGNVHLVDFLKHWGAVFDFRVIFESCTLSFIEIGGGVIIWPTVSLVENYENKQNLPSSIVSPVYQRGRTGQNRSLSINYMQGPDCPLVKMEEVSKDESQMNMSDYNLIISSFFKRLCEMEMVNFSGAACSAHINHINLCRPAIIKSYKNPIGLRKSF